MKTRSTAILALLTGAAIGAIEPSAGMGHTGSGRELGTLFLAAQLWPYGLYRRVALDRPGAQPVRRAADESHQLAWCE